MMDLKVVIFALLLITLQHTVGDSSQAIPADDVSKIERAEPSHYHHPHRRAAVWGLLLRLFKRQKNKDNSETQFSSNMKWEKYQNLENLVTVSNKNKEDKYYYIARDNNCKPSFTDIPPSDSEKSLVFLVNPDNFENLEWKSVSKGKIPPLSVETCDGHIIARSENGLGYMTAKSKTITITNPKVSTTPGKNIEVLTVIFDDIAEEYLTNITFSAESAQRNNKPAMFKKLTVVNNNCKAMKQVVKIDNDFEETASYQTGSTLLVGASLGIKKIFEAGLKSDSSATETESNSNIKKTRYEYTQELDVPPNSSCNLVIISTTLVTTVPFTADLTRVYKNDDISTVSISGTYHYQESSEIKTDFESCTKLPDKCLTKST